MVAPILNTSFSPAFPEVMESHANPAGITIAALLPEGSISDSDGAVKAIAVTHLDTGMGSWQYSLDGGASWLTIQADLINSTTNELALLLGPTAKLRLLPFGDLNGTLAEAVTFRAWDMSDGLASGSYSVITATGGNTSFSAASDTASLTIAPVNDAPTFIQGTGLTFVPSHPVFGDDYARAMLLQPDGKILVGGYSRLLQGEQAYSLVRLNRDGSLDTNFNGDGKLTVAAGPFAYTIDMTLQSDGKIILVGQNWNGVSDHFALLRVTADGNVDTGFGNQGHVHLDVVDGYDSARAVVVQLDGKIVVAGVVRVDEGDSLTIVRLNANGALDTGFGNSGKTVAPFGVGIDVVRDILLQPDGRIVVIGSTPDNQIGMVRLNPNGTLDNGFGINGRVKASVGDNTLGESAVLQHDGKIIVGGYGSHGTSGEDFVVMRFNVNGSLDSSFAQNGRAVIDLDGRANLARSISLQADGKILLAGQAKNGQADEINVVRLNADGTLDTSFSGDGKLVIPLGGHSDHGFIFSVAPQPDGKIVLAGYGEQYPTTWDPDFLIVRLNADGSLDSTFNLDPANTTLGQSSTLSIGGTPIPLDQHVAVYDPELAAMNNGLGNYAAASVTVERTGGANPDDLFSALGRLSFNGGDLVLSGMVVGRVDSGDGTLSMTFNDKATQAVVNEVLSSIGYSNGNPQAPQSIEFDWYFSDGNSSSQGLGGELSVMGRSRVGWNLFSEPEVLWISGAPIRGQTLTALLVDNDHPLPVSYQWLRDGAPIDGATGTNYVLTSADVGRALSVEAFHIMSSEGGRQDLATSDIKLVFETATAAQHDLIAMYVLILGRAPDADGLAFWNTRVEQGYSFEDVANRMWESPGAKEFYPRDFTTEQMVTNVYNNILERDPDDGGKMHWTKLWNSVGPVETMMRMIDALTANNSIDPQALVDKQLFLNKIEVGSYFAVTRESNDIDVAHAAYDYLDNGNSLHHTLIYVDNLLG
ncbi:MAG: DUF4214 domain-containing protein [Porticoccaceae bacterium]